jgi:7-keto-8-aminopelargonate synthetase-like enzyme
MGGDLCPLPEVLDACRRYGARLLVDDAHGIGVLAQGRGTSAHFGLSDQVDLVSVTFSKALASVGGAVLGSTEVIEYLRHHARSLIFSAAASPASLAAALASLRVLRAEPWRCEQALANAGWVRDRLVELDYTVLPSRTPILCVPTFDLPATVTTWRALLDHGVYVNAVLPPAASPRLRLSFTASHTPRQLRAAVDAFAAVRDLVPAGPAEFELPEDAADDLAALAA